MTQLLDRLEDQLVDAARRETSRPRRFPALPRPRVVLPTLAAVGAAAAIAGLFLGGGTEPREAAPPAGERAAPAVAPTEERTAIPPPTLEQRKARAKTSVFVLNGTTRNGVGTRTAKLLEAAGFRIVGVGNTPTNAVERSRAYYVRNAPEFAERGFDVSRALLVPAAPDPSRTLRDISGGARVIVVVGKDFVTPRPGPDRVLATPAGIQRGIVRERQGTLGPELTFEVEGLEGSRNGLWITARVTARRFEGQFLGFFPQPNPADGVSRRTIDPRSLERLNVSAILVTREPADRRQGDRPGETILGWPIS